MPADILLQLKDWYSDPALNVPAGGTLVSNNLDDNLRTILAVVRMLASSNSLAVGATTNLGTRDETFLTLTGAGATISSFGTLSAGMFKVIVFDGINTLVQNATSMKLPAGEHHHRRGRRRADAVAGLRELALPVLQQGQRQPGVDQHPVGRWHGGRPGPGIRVGDRARHLPPLGRRARVRAGRHVSSRPTPTASRWRYLARPAPSRLAPAGILTNGINVVGNIGVGSRHRRVQRIRSERRALLLGGDRAFLQLALWGHRRQRRQQHRLRVLRWKLWRRLFQGDHHRIGCVGRRHDHDDPADYAEMFEVGGRQPGRRGPRRLLGGAGGRKIRVAGPEDTPIGIVSGNPAVLGDAGDLRWVDQYLRDAFNRPVLEDAELIEWADEEGVLHTYYADTLPADVTPPACQAGAGAAAQGQSCVRPVGGLHAQAGTQGVGGRGLMGKLRLRNDQCVSTRWVHMRDITDDDPSGW